MLLKLHLWGHVNRYVLDCVAAPLATYKRFKYACFGSLRVRYYRIRNEPFKFLSQWNNFVLFSTQLWKWGIKERLFECCHVWNMILDNLFHQICVTSRNFSRSYCPKLTKRKKQIIKFKLLEPVINLPSCYVQM